MPGSERARGVLLGLALGDALGAPFEGRRRIGRDELAAWCAAKEPLRWTDDTHMALTLARRLVEDPALSDPEALGSAFAAAYAREPWRGYGAGPPQIFAMVEHGMRFEDAAGSLFGGSGSFGNGAAMRVAPVGLLPATDLDEVARVASVQARLTHTHPDGVAGAVLIAQVVARLLRHDEVDAEKLRLLVTDVIEQSTASAVRDRAVQVLEVLSAGGDARSAADRCGTGIAAAESVPAALVALLTGGDVLRVVTVAIRLGGDTDTIAAMAGAMAGAAWGLDGVPAQLLARLEARDELGRLAVTLNAR